MTPRLRRSYRPRLCLETLERRLAPATFTVTNTADGGTGSLRLAIINANGSGGQDTINFQAGVTGTINLTAPLVVTDSVIINGPGAAALNVSGQNAVRPFTISNSNSSVISVLIFDLTVTAGRSNGADGGGVFIDNESVRLDRVVVSNCTTTGAGGGVFVGTGGTLFLQDSTITGNSATGGTTNRGGGVYFFNGGALNMQGCTLVGNTATGTNGGGGLYFFGAPSALYGGVTVSNCTIAGNTAPIGGGIALRQLNTAANPVTIQNSTITGNTSTTTATASGDGGGGLSVVSGAGVNVRVRSTILSGNTAANGRSDIATGPELLINNTAIGVFNGTNQAPGSSNNLINQALFLNSLADNGGRTQTISFAANSPLRNAGSNAGGLLTDQRGAGFSRVVGPAADIGAFEAPLVVANLNDSGPGSLRQAILDANASFGNSQTITFQAGLTGTINLASTLSITRDVSIAGPGASAVTVSGQNARRVFTIDDGTAAVINVAIAGLTVTGGNANAVGRGGGLFIGNEAVTLDRVVVTNNVGVQGGGIGLDADGQLTVRNSTIANNSTSFGGGGGIHFDFRGSLLLENSTVAANTANGGQGGGIQFNGTVGPGGFTVRNSTITGNTATDGGGVAFYYSPTPAAPILFQNSTITNNSATTTLTAPGRGGGGIALRGPNTGTVNIVSTIVSGNTATPANACSDIVSQATQPNINFSAIGDPDGFTPSGTSGNNLPDGTALGLGTLQNNGGPTQTIAFAANSPLLNAGSNPANLATDQRGPGFARVQGSAADIGAFEAPSFIVTNLNDAGGGSLRQAIANANATAGVAETITFQAGLTGTITLGSPLTITDGVTIAGPGAAALSVSGNGSVRAFTIDNGNAAAIAVTIAGLTVTNGSVSGVNGANLFTANENVTLDGVAVRNGATVGVGLGSGSGAGIAVDSGGVLTVRNSTVSGNSANNRGGGIYFFNGGSLLLENSTVSGNSAFDANGGGGVYFFGSVAAGGVTIRNSTIANNIAPSGGGLALNTLNTTAAPVLIQNSTFTGNGALTLGTAPGQGGGGIALTTANAATITIVSTIVSGNTASAANGRSDIAVPASATVNVNFSAIGDPDGFTRSATSNNNLPDGAALGLGSLGNNGGPTQTISFADTSPLRNAGSNPANLAFDQRGAGFPRVFGAAADIGAFELQSAPGVAPRVTGVTVNAGQANTQQRSRVTTVTVTFDAQVTFAGGDMAAAFGLSRIGGAAVGGFTANAAVVNNVTVVTLTGFTGAETNFGSLADGRYIVLVRANLVSAGGQQLDGDGNGTGGDDFTLNGTTANGLFRLFGDVDGSGVVNAADFGQFRPAFGSVVGNSQYRDFLDFDNSGAINAFDFGQFRPRFGAGVP